MVPAERGRARRGALLLSPPESTFTRRLVGLVLPVPLR